MEKIDTTNDFGLGVQGSGIVFLMPPMPPGAFIEKEMALRLAAYIVVLIDYDGRFEQIKDALGG